MNTQFLKRLLFQNSALKAVAFILTLSLFIWVRDDREASVVAYAPVRIVIPDGKTLVNPPVERVRLTVRGRWNDVNGFDPTSVPPIRIEATSDDEHQLIPITADMIRLPRGLKTIVIQPDVVTMELETKAKKRVPIKARVVGEPRQNYRAFAPKIQPTNMMFSGPQSSIDKLEFVQTEPIDISDRMTSFKGQVTLVNEDPLLSYDLSIPIQVEIPIETMEVTRTVQAVPVVALNFPHDVVLAPGAISVTVRGPKGTVDALKAPDIQASIDLKNETRVGTIQLQPVMKNLPEGVALVDYHPKDVLVTIKAPQSPPQ